MYLQKCAINKEIRIMYTTISKSRTNGLSDQWAVGPMGCRTNGLSNQWAVGPQGSYHEELIYL